MPRWLVLLAALAVVAAAHGSPGSRRLIARARELAHQSPPRLREALSLLERAAQADPRDQDARFFLGYVAVACDEPRRALAALDGLSRPHAAFLRGRALAALDRHQEAIDAYAAEKAKTPELAKYRKISERAVDDVQVTLQPPPPRLRTSVATRFEYGDRGTDPAGDAVSGRGVTSLDLDYLLSQRGPTTIAAAVGGTYLGDADAANPASGNGRAGLYGSTSRGPMTAGLDLEVYGNRGDELFDSTTAGVRTWLEYAGWESHRPQLSCELARRDMTLATELAEEDRDGWLTTVTLSHSWLVHRLGAGFLELRGGLTLGDEATVGGFYDTSSRAAQLAVALPAALWRDAPTTVEVGGSYDRTGYTDLRHTEAMGGERTDRTAAQWVRVRQPFPNGKTTVEVRYDRTRRTSTLEGLELSGDVGSIGVQQVF